ncbi:Protein AIG2 [Cyphellophora attinorum]|uniref:Putative gamma-glutamylcyclotransferase n=1 Tax=Cyphellophora attinorum TaxID=1664694 RepID=A0A0N1P016_9EURO|nr:Protein AIG2 [Phialophora attinorum]KPI41957.1 Protein AIG2 [Phialophora attinorum]
MGTNTLFFYGTLMAPPVLYRVIYGTSSPKPEEYPAMKFLSVRSGLLRGHRRHRVVGADYPAVTPEKGGSVRGTLVGGLTEGDVWRLDVFEGSQYERREVGVDVLEGVGLGEAKEPETVKAQTYIWASPLEELESQEWDFENFKRRKMSRWAGLESDDGGWGGSSEDNEEVVEEDQGFADVEHAVRNGDVVDKARDGVRGDDGMGGRGINGVIGRQLAEVQRNGAR